MKRIVLVMGLLFSLPSSAEIAKGEKYELFYPMEPLPSGKDKTKLCKALTEKSAQRQKFTKGKSKLPPPVNVCEPSSINVTLEDKATLPTNKTYTSVSTMVYAFGSGGYLAAVVETKAGLYAVDLAPVTESTAEEKENQRLTILSIKTQDVVSSRAGEELLIQFSTTTKKASQTSIKESLVICGINKELSCLMPIRIAESNTTGEVTRSWKLSYKFADNKLTLSPDEVNGEKKTNSKGLTNYTAKSLGAWEIPL